MNRAFHELPLGAVKPLGWLRDQLRLQADGFTGLLPDHWPDVGPNSSWLGGTGEDWERGPYYCDGLIPLAHLLGDERLLARADRWVEWSLASQRPDGFFGPATNADWWPRMVMLKALTQHAEATGDPRVPKLMAAYFAHQARELEARPLEKWGQARGAENVLGARWLLARAGAPHLLDLIALVESQTLDWTTWFLERVPTSRVTTFDHYTHVVNVAMAVKEPALRWLRTGDEQYRRAVYEGLASLDRYHGQPQGMFSGDEWLATRDPTAGVELCAVVELAFSLEQLVAIWGDVAHADRLERVIYNALPATISADVRARQYDQQPNQVLCSVARRNWTQNKDDSNIFGLEPNFGCCTANLHQGWPKFVSHMWMAGGPDELVAVAYGPCEVRHGGLAVREVTEYPFRDDVRLEVSGSGTLLLRVPGWCDGAEVNREPRSLEPGRFHRLRVSDGDVVELHLRASIRFEGRDKHADVVHRGPLTFALRVGEEWRPIGRHEPFVDWEVHPTTPWNYAVVEQPLRLEQRAVSKVPWSGEAPPIVLHTQGRRVPWWTLVDNSAGPLPESPVQVDTPTEPIELIPYGCARLRITELPTTRP
ncbi:MAG TPA: beta-L-arabinofuranosidase domain-containing protein [Chloroflexota bacterium]|nr:beta-L-arabinofuranosidase domain-containing protein [Chloroflexota bacterium]